MPPPKEISLALLLKNTAEGETFITSRASKTVTSYTHRYGMKASTRKCQMIDPESDKIISVLVVTVLKAYDEASHYMATHHDQQS